ncbi:hypothetical protein FB446DRAFT_704049 [Lentinula raphanica]|nr:hypothetical protein FB446DRAFT_704049 [Lentinula raphanica]
MHQTLLISERSLNARLENNKLEKIGICDGEKRRSIGYKTDGEHSMNLDRGGWTTQLSRFTAKDETELWFGVRFGTWLDVEVVAEARVTKFERDTTWNGKSLKLIRGVTRHAHGSPPMSMLYGRPEYIPIDPVVHTRKGKKSRQRTSSHDRPAAPLNIRKNDLPFSSSYPPKSGLPIISKSQEGHLVEVYEEVALGRPEFGLIGRTL